MKFEYPNSLSVLPCDPKGYKLMHDGVVALSQVEANGLQIDEVYLEETMEKLSKQIKRITEKLKQKKMWTRWKKRFGSKAKLTSGDQLATLLFLDMGYPIKVWTERGAPSSDENHLATVDLPFVRGYTKLQKCIKARNTYLMGIKRETVNGFIHPVFNLHIPKSYRSSSDQPNFQNQPSRNPWMAKLIRTCFIPRKGHRIVEFDFSGVEVSVAACYHKDPTMINYLLDPASDMHRDMAAQIFKLKTNQVEKNVRHCAKNKFVFPEFYGDYFASCAKSMWESVGIDNLKVGETSLYDHLKKNGIKELGPTEYEKGVEPGEDTFVHHMKEVEHDFWNNRFGVYGEWKKKWVNKYKKRGWFDTLTGFRIEGDMVDRKVINYPIQGSAFHCLLFCLIELQKALTKYKMKSVIVGQIHDSIVGDVHEKEFKYYLELANEIMTKKINKFADWLVVPLEVEAEVTGVDASWYTKKEIKL